MAANRLTPLQLAALALPWIGVQAIWSTEFGVITTVMERYELSKFWASNIWIFGPITGFFCAPVVGALSDACQSRFGRRKPYIVTGLLSTLVFSIIFALSYKYGSAKLPISFVSFILLDITINVMQTPLRALAGDNAAEDQQTTVQLLATFFQGIGAMVGFGLTRAFWTGEPEQLPKLIFTVMAINVVLITLTCFLVSEKPTTRAPAKVKIVEPFVVVARNVFKMDVKMAIVCAIEFFSWAAAFAWWPAASTWWGINVYHGINCDTKDPSCDPVRKADFEEGTKNYGDSSIYQSLIQTAFGMLLAVLVARNILKRVKMPFFLCLAIGAVFFILAKFGPQTVGMAYVVSLMWAIPNSAINAFPFALVGKYAAQDTSDETGVRMGLLNWFICVPQLIITFVVSALRDRLGDEGLPWAFLIAGICLGIAAVLALFIREEDKPVSDVNRAMDGEVSQVKK